MPAPSRSARARNAPSSSAITSAPAACDSDPAHDRRGNGGTNTGTSASNPGTPRTASADATRSDSTRSIIVP